MVQGSRVKCGQPAAMFCSGGFGDASGIYTEGYDPALIWLSMMPNSLVLSEISIRSGHRFLVLMDLGNFNIHRPISF